MVFLILKNNKKKFKKKLIKKNMRMRWYNFADILSYITQAFVRYPIVTHFNQKY